MSGIGKFDNDGVFEEVSDALTVGGLETGPVGRKILDVAKEVIDVESDVVLVVLLSVEIVDELVDFEEDVGKLGFGELGDELVEDAPAEVANEVFEAVFLEGFEAGGE